MFETRNANVPAPDKTAEGSAIPDAAAVAAAEKSVAMLAQALATAQMYGVVHKVSSKMLEDGFPVFAEGLEKTGKLTLMLTDKGLLVNGVPLANRSGQIAGLARRLQTVGLPTLTLSRGFGQPEFEKLLAVLTAPAPAGGGPPPQVSAQTLREAGLSHVSANASGAMRMVGEEDHVVKRDTPRRPNSGKAPAALLEEARAFLQGRAGADRAAGAGLEDAVVDGRTLSQLLVEVGRSLQPGGPERSAADIRTILNRAASQAQAATAAAQKTLRVIESKTRDQTRDTPEHKELIALIAELAQELSQPLTIVNATIDIIRRAPPAAGQEGQNELLSMASDSGKRLAELVSRLVQIAGTPKSLSPDADRLKTIYQAPGTKSG